MASGFTRIRKDRSGAVAFETVFMMLVMAGAMFGPMADVGVAAVQYISAFQALRDLGTYVQYHAPQDLSDATIATWKTNLPQITGHAIVAKVYCGDTVKLCGSTNVATPKYYSLTTSITLTPVVVPFPKTPITLTYSQRFE